MSKKSRWLDGVPVEKKRAKTALSQTDRTDMGTVTEIMGEGNVAVHIDESSDPDVVAPVVAGVTALGARVRLTRDSAGKVTQVEAPDRLPEGADPVFVGVTGETVEKLADAQVDLDEAMGELDTKVGEAESNAAQAVADAASAQTSVNGVNARMTSVAEPSTRPNGAQLVSGDEWFVDDGTGQIVDVRIWNGNSWVPYKLVLSSLAVAGSVGNILLENGAVDATKITASESLWAKIGVFAEITTQMLVAGGAKILDDMLVDGAVTARTLNVFPNTGDGGMILDGQGMDIIPADSEGDSAISLRADSDMWISFTKNAETTFSVDPAGKGSIKTLSVNDSFAYRGTELQDTLDTLPRGIVGWGGGWAWPGQPTVLVDGEISICDLTVDLVAGRLYTLGYHFGWAAHNTDVAIEIRIRETHSTSGVPDSPTAATNMIYKLRYTGLPNGYVRTESDEGLTFAPDVSGTYRFLFSAAEAYRAKSAALRYDSIVPIFYIRDEGLKGPQLTNPSKVIAPSPAAPPAAKKTYETTLAPIAFGDYRGNGAAYNYFSGRVCQGGSPAGYGALHGLWVFPSLAATLSGADILWVAIYLENAHAYQNSGLVAHLQYHGYGSLPSTYGGGSSLADVAFGKGEGKWVEANSLASGLKTGAIRGFGVSGSALADYGYFTGATARLYVKYAK